MEIDPHIFFEDLIKLSGDVNKGPFECFRLLESLNRSLIEDQINSSLVDLYLIHIFEKSNGLIKFINANVRNKIFKNAITKAVEILYTIVNNFPSKLIENNILEIHSICISTIKSDAFAEVKVKILELLLICLEKLDICFETDELCCTYKQLLNSLQTALKQKHSDTVKHKELIALGYFVKRYQYLITNPKDLWQLFVRHFDAEVIKPKKSQHIICGFFTGFSYYCESYPLNLTNSDDKKLIERIYNFLKVLVSPTERIKTGNRAAILFLSSNASEFGDLLLKDYKFWHRKLLNWLEFGPDEKKAGAATLRSFFQVISAIVYNKDSNGDCQSIVEYFNNWCKNTLKKENISNYEKHLAIQCLRLFSAASYKHIPQKDVTDLFLFIMQTFEYTYILNYNPSNEEWEYLPDYVQTVANFMQFKTFNPSEFCCLQRAVVNMIKSFHELPYLHYGLVIDGIVTTCFYMKKTHYFDAFVENVVYQGVLWSCSHQHISNAEFSEETTEKIVTVKNFFPLWLGVLKLSSNRTYDKYGLYLEDRKYILARIVNQLVKTLMVLINKLNVSVSLKEEVAVTEIEKVYQVEQRSDYAIFLNVIDFYQEIFDNIEPRMLKKCVCKIIKHIINKCVEYPLISGFYKLLSYSLKISNKLCLFIKQESVNQDIVNARETLIKFLQILLDKMIQYKDELLIACLQVLLECPVIIIKDMLSLCVIPFATVFTVGRSYLPLAEMGLNTLEQWQDNMTHNDLDPFLTKVIFSLDSYLRSKSLHGYAQASIMGKRRKTAQTLKKRKVLLELEPELVKLQNRILVFIGKQNSKICQEFVYANNIEPVTICGDNMHLKVTLPYEDTHLDVYLDAFVLQVVNLALYSSDRKVRITACESLQAIVMMFLGRAKPMSQSGLSEVEGVLEAIALPLLQLGSDIDQLVQQIFAPLCQQLIHWYTSPTQLRGSHTAIIINALMEGITHPTNSCLRDFSGKCINEFVKWTLKQTNELHISRDPVNIKVLIKNMRFFSTHPDCAKKLGAALIFNNIYREIREEEALISIFWLEILHIFVNSLDLIVDYSIEDSNTINQINQSLLHLQRVFVGKPQIFRKKDDRRRIPNDMKGGTLKDVAIWLLQHTGSKSGHCRSSCMDLFITLAPIISEKKVNLQAFIGENCSDNFISDLYEKFILQNPTLMDITQLEDCDVLLKWMQGFLCALDGYNFVITNNLGNVEFINNPTFAVIYYFLNNLQKADMAKALNLINHRSWIFTSLDREQFYKQKSACVLSILKLLNSIITDEILCEKSAIIWTSDIWNFILNATFHYQQLGLDDRVTQPKHLDLLTILLNNIPRKFNEGKLFGLIEMLHNFIEKNCFTTIDLKKNVSLIQRNIIRGLLLLKSTNINRQLKIEKYSSGLINELMQKFYNTVDDDNSIFVNELQETTLEHCNLILKFSLENLTEFKHLVKHLHQPHVVQTIEFNKEVKFGIYILHTFGEVVIPIISKNFNYFIQLSFENGNLNITLELLMFILNYISKNRGSEQHFDDISKTILEKWSDFENFFNANFENMHLGVEFLKFVLPICKSQCYEFHPWLVNQLSQEENLNNKLEIFFLLVETIHENSQTSVDLENGLEVLTRQVVSCIAKSDENSLIFSKILSIIPKVKSTTILKSLVELYEQLYTDLEIAHLFEKYMTAVNENLQHSTLTLIYKMYYDKHVSFENRYKILKTIIPPLFQNCRIICFERFYIQHINNIISELEDEDNFEINILNFVLVEVLFLRIPIGTIERNICSISNAANNPKLLHVLLKFALDAFKITSKESSELLRIYKCHAYNALASIVSNSLKSPSFYDKLFIRQENNQDILWSGIIDTHIVYDFPILFDSIPAKRKILVNIRNEIRTQQNGERSKSVKYIESQKLFNSSLSEDVTNFDFTNTVLRIQKITEEEDIPINCQSEIQLDAIKVNNHECMATICALIQHIFQTGVNKIPEEDEVDFLLPSWMKGIRATLLSEETHKNIKIFLVKVIDNMIHIFSHYAKWFVEPLLQFITGKCAGNGINFFVTDVLIILAKWSSNIVHLNEKESQLASDMLIFFISNLKIDRLDVFKYNLDLIKLIVESWKNYIKVPFFQIFEAISSEEKCEIGIHLTSIFLVNNLPPWEENKIEHFLSSLLKLLKSPKKSIYRSCSETVGLMLKYLKHDQYVEKVDIHLKKIADFNKYVYCLEGIAIYFPQLVNAYHICKLICSLNQFPDPQKILHLKIINRRLEVSLDILEEVSDFQIIEWEELLENANLEIQIITLDIIKKCLSVFMNYKGYVNIVKSLSRNVSSPNILYRSCVYDIAILMYQQNKDDLEVCREILIFGLVDIDSDNRKKVMQFWKNNANLPNTVASRFSYLLSNLYKTKMEDQFLSYVNYFLLDLLKECDEYNSPIFEHPLEDCNFEDYHLQLNWRLQHPSVVPLFAETLQTYDKSLESYSEMNLFQLKETQTNLAFAPTKSVREQEFSKYTNLESSLSVDLFNSENIIKDPNNLILSQKYRLPRRRFLKDKSKISRSHAHYETKKQVKKIQQRKDMVKEREKSVTIYRKYRKGDFPDIQILLSSVLEPLQMLSLHDGEVSKLLFSEIFKSLLSKVENNDVFIETISNSIKNIFNISTHFNPNLFSTLLDIVLKNKNKIKLEPQLLSSVCQQSGLVSLGTLLLEEYLICFDDEDQPSSSKKGSGSEENGETLYWVKLAELYKELEEWDVVRSIFLEKMNCKDIIQQGIQYESEGQWRNAQDIYKQLIETDMSVLRKDYYYESYFKCFANLGEWEYLPETIDSVITTTENDNAWDLLWDSGWCQQKLLPWYINAQVKNILFSQMWSEGFSQNINKCLNDAEKAEYLRINFSEELCIMWLFKKDIPTANLYLQHYIKNFLNDWQLLNPMFHSLRYNKVLKLRNVIEAKEFISIYNNLSDDFEISLKKLTSSWQNTSSEMLSSILLNETQVLYRNLFINLLKEKISKFQHVDLDEPMKNLQSSRINLDMGLIEAAVQLNNYYVARKYVKKYANMEDLKCQLAFGSVVLLKSKMMTIQQEELKASFQAMEIFGSIIDATKKQSIFLPACMKYFDTIINISQILYNNQELFIEYQTKLTQRLKKIVNSPGEVRMHAAKMLHLAVENVKEDNMDCDNSEINSRCKDISNAYVKLAQFTRDQNNDNLQGDFILYVLRAMKLNSLEGKQLFPCILMQSRLGTEYNRLFIMESEKIPTWMFLGWIPQLLANVDSQNIFAISKVIIRIAETYPQAIMYPYRLSREHFKFTDSNVAEEARFLTTSLDKLLLGDPMVDKFLKALSYVTMPAAKLEYYITKMYKAKSEDDTKAIENCIFSDIFGETPESRNVKNMQGNMFKNIIKFKTTLQKILSPKNNKIKEHLIKLNTELKAMVKHDKTSSLLKDYCPWLANFSANRLNIELEIPGQYDGQKLPLMQHHIKISGFCPNVLVMTSLRKPIKLTILGMDTKEYPFLIKFGEDIRQDQRVEQLFGLMNNIFRSDSTCAYASLNILTYQVIPLTSNLGMIQWVNDTQSLTKFIKKALKTRELKDFERVSEDYANWLYKSSDALHCYGMSALKYDRNKTVAFYRSLVNRIPWDVMRTSFWSLSTSTEHYIALRNNFIKTYAVLCSSQWIVGIGDRHLENSLICIKSGKVLGIDFGHAFGTATQILAVPELVPFRLTPHIVNLMEPLKERGPFREYMIHCLRALRINCSSLLATLNVFVEEPSMDWLEQASKFDNGTNANTHNWYPNVKVNQAKRKLQGVSSTKILIEDLVAGQKIAKYTEAYVKLITDVEFNLRTKMLNENLSVENQVDCLIDHAMDYNLLGRMWVGWTPWV